MNDDSIHHVGETDSKNDNEKVASVRVWWVRPSGPVTGIPQKDLERLQKKFKLTNEQMKKAMEQSRLRDFAERRLSRSARGTFTTTSIAFLSHCVIIIAVLIYVVNRDYDDIISFWFALYFPMEANALGMFVPEPKSAKLHEKTTTMERSRWPSCWKCRQREFAVVPATAFLVMGSTHVPHGSCMLSNWLCCL
jgi:hypothetical protein